MADDALQRYLNWRKATLGAIGLFVLIGAVDLLGLDNYLHRTVCGAFWTINHAVVCTSYYDMPIWQALTAIGTISAVIAAIWFSLHQSSHHCD